MFTIIIFLFTILQIVSKFFHCLHNDKRANSPVKAVMNLKSVNDQKLFIKLNKPASISLRLFCFPHAGGGISIFRDWASHLPIDTELFVLQLPGRESKFDEKLFNDINQVIIKLCDEFPNDSEIPFIFFGHSLGALIGFELCRALRRLKSIEPVHLIASGATAPQLCYKKDKISINSDKDFLDKVEKYGGFHEGALKDKDFMSLLLPMLRADFSLFESYRYYDELPFSFDITTIRGIEDRTCPPQDVVEWGLHTEKNIEHFTVPGGHFFIRDSFFKVMEIVNRILKINSEYFNKCN